jgi:hypothetical protein
MSEYRRIYQHTGVMEARLIIAAFVCNNMILSTFFLTHSCYASMIDYYSIEFKITWTIDALATSTLEILI